jgi:N-acetylneuraminate synthase
MHTLIIAEAGVNHNGDINIAHQMIDVAAEAGVDYIKFQTFKSVRAVSRKAAQASYQTENTGVKENQLEMLKRLELTEEEHFLLQEHCKKRKVGFISTAFDQDSADFLANMDMDLWKIPSGEITNFPFLKFVSEQGKPVVLSTGMAMIEEVRMAIDVLLSGRVCKGDLTILHCTSEYPAPFEGVNLSAMETLKNEFGLKVGYSDHTVGIEVPIAAVALGATVIEKHFTLDKNMAGPDHKASINPIELQNMVIAIRNIEKSLGSGHKIPTSAELETAKVARKSIHIIKPLERGYIITKDDLIMMRPGIGISPMCIDEVIGKQLVSDLEEYTMLSWDMLK